MEDSDTHRPRFCHTYCGHLVYFSAYVNDTGSDILIVFLVLECAGFLCIYKKPYFGHSVATCLLDCLMYNIRCNYGIAQLNGCWLSFSVMTSGLTSLRGCCFPYVVFYVCIVML